MLGDGKQEPLTADNPQFIIKMNKEKTLREKYFERSLSRSSKTFFQLGQKELAKEILDEIRKEIDFNNIWLNNEDFEGIQRDMLDTFQISLNNLKQIIKQKSGFEE